MSAVVANVLIILLVVVGVALIWATVRPSIEGGSEGLRVSDFTLNLAVQSAVFNSNNNIASVSVKRSVGEGNIQEIKFIFTDTSGNSEVYFDNTPINELETIAYNIDLTGSTLNLGNIKDVTIAPVFGGIVGRISSTKEIEVVSSGGGGTTQCNDGSDNDGDGWNNADDPGCWDTQWEPSSYNPNDDDESNPSTGYECSNNIDDDSDGNIDGTDGKCVVWNDFVEAEECRDGNDNDGDGAIDYSVDYSCGGDPDNDDETNPLAQCQDQIDNDLPLDGLCDFDGASGSPGCSGLVDPGCSSFQDNDETNVATPECNDGTDNDVDGAFDFPDDVGCTSASDNDEGSFDSSDLIVLYHFEGNFMDSSGNGNDGTPNGGMSTLVPGVPHGGFGQVAGFDGSDDYVQTPALVTMAGTIDFTWSAWINADCNDCVAHIFWEGDASGSGGNGGGNQFEAGFSLGNPIGATTTGNLACHIDRDGLYLPISADINLETPYTYINEWHHVALVVNSLNNVNPTAQIYVDGSISASYSDPGIAVQTIAWNSQVRIGRPGRDERYFDGDIDEVSIWKRALTSAEISLLAGSSPLPI